MGLGFNMVASVPFYGYTHAGVFHADDVCATALLKQLNPEFEVERVFSVPEDACGIVYDIGGGEFDHHQANSPVRNNGVPYAAFGLLWKEYGEMILPDARDRRAFDKGFVQPIDLVDNRGGFHPISQLISDFNARDASNAELQDIRFEQAVDMMSTVLANRFERIREQRFDLDIVETLRDAGDGQILVMNEWRNWQSALVGSSYAYAVYPSNRGGWNVQGVPVEMGSGEVVIPFPESWRGLSGVDAELASGIDGLTFCHASGFLCATDTEEAAIQVAHASLKDFGLEYEQYDDDDFGFD